jgi:hypothetical protein
VNLTSVSFSKTLISYASGHSFFMLSSSSVYATSMNESSDSPLHQYGYFYRPFDWTVVVTAVGFFNVKSCSNHIVINLIIFLF